MAEYRSAAGTIEQGDGGCMRLLRCPTKGDIGGVITSYQIHQLWTHYHRGRTVGCSKPKCPGCAQLCPTRYEAYFGLYSPRTKQHVLFGTTVNGTRQILDQIGRLDRLRGLHLKFRRQAGKPNGRVMVECQLMTPDPSDLPAQPDVLRELMKIWGVEHAAEVFGFDFPKVDTSVQDGLLEQTENFGNVNERWTTVESIDFEEIDDQLHFPGMGT